MDFEAPGSIAAAGRLLRSGELRSSALVRAHFDRIRSLDPHLGACLATFEEQALAAARRADDELGAQTDRGPLHGIPVALKDIIACADGPTTAQSRVLSEGWAAGTDALVVERLRRAGAVIVAKTSTQEFACGMPGVDDAFPTPRNPWDLGRWAGGSSSGSASGVAAGLFLAALGSDTAGSIRIPAAFCGVTGMKPTAGLVPTAGVVPLSASADHVGPLARSAADCAAVLAAIADPAPRPDGVIDAPLTGMRIGVVDDLDHLPAGTDPTLVARWRDAIDVLAGLGAQLTSLSLPMFPELRAATTLIVMAEAFAYHRRSLATCWDAYGGDARQVISLGALVPASEYLEARRLVAVGRARVHALFAEEVDLVVSPTASITAPPIAELSTAALFDRVNCAYWNAIGAPVVSVPVGLAGDGLPVGMQIAGPRFADARVLAAAVAFQRRTGWHRLAPPVGECSGSCGLTDHGVGEAVARARLESSGEQLDDLEDGRAFVHALVAAMEPAAAPAALDQAGQWWLATSDASSDASTDAWNPRER